VHDDYQTATLTTFMTFTTIVNIVGAASRWEKCSLGKRSTTILAVFSPLKLRLKLNEEIKEFLIDPLGVKVFNNFFSSSLFLPPKIS
jgi:hypothetical protein